MTYREPVLKQHRKIWLTKESYDFLREQKREQKKSMAQILEDLINKQHKEKL